MKTIPVVTVFVLLFALTAYKQDNLSEMKDALHERFNGKYEVLSSLSNKEVDVNLDGKFTSDLEEELSDLSHAYLELRVPKKENYNLFCLFLAGATY